MNDNVTNEAAQGQQPDKDPRHTRTGMNDMIEKVTKGHKTLGIIVAIAMIVLGIVIMVMPVKSAIVVMYLATIGFIVFGIHQIVVYARTPHELKNGWNLANGIIFIVLGVLILLSSTASMAVTFAFLLGFIALFSGITQISSFGVYKKAGDPAAGWILTSGIINLLLGIFFIFTPFVATLAIWFVFAFYLIVGGIALFAEAASGHHGHKA